MKMMKSLLLGSAAGLVAIAGAQAADLPVKAKAVEYVKVCTAYGAGFYYIPGTDICLRVGGFVFFEAGINGRNAQPHILAGNIGAALVYDRFDNETAYRGGTAVILDARSQTAIGTVRSYMSLNIHGFTAAAPLAVAGPGNVGANFLAYIDRGFIQFAGFTAGFAGSFFEFGPSYSIMSLASVAWSWRPLAAYTAAFGNGVSATISIEDATTARSKLVTGAYTGVSTAVNTNYGGSSMPDIVGNFRVDQAWGSAQIMGALHQLRVNQILANAGTADEWGWAVGGGIEIKTPTIAPGDSIMLQGVWSSGAVVYTGISSHPFAIAQGVGLRTTAGVGPALDVFDAYFNAAGTPLLRTDAWSANAQFRHFWQPNLRSAFWVGYNFVDPGGNSATALGGDPDFRMWQAGANIVWSPARTLDLSLDVLYSNLATGSCTGLGAGVQAASCNQTADIWTVWTRWRRAF